jgi:hypothetical protein
MQFALAFPKSPETPQTTTVAIDVQARRGGAYEILARILAQAVEAPKPMEVGNE